MKARMPLWKLHAVVVAAVAVAATGCGFGERLHSVEGTITAVDGTPLANIRMVFTAQGRSLSATGRTDAHGHYRLGTAAPGAGTPAGDYTVVAIDDDRGLDIDHPKPSRISLRYANPATSGLAARITAPRNRFDFVLDRGDRP
jgi:hypothetical protein